MTIDLPGVPVERPALTVLYDAACPVCRRARRWVERQTTYVPVEFVPAGTPAATARFPHLDHAATLRQVTVIGEDGAVYAGDEAWIVVLWACTSTRLLATDLAAGRRQRTFGGIKGATEWIRRLTAGVPDPWPAPDPRRRIG